MKLKTKLLIGFLVVSVVPLAAVSHYTLDIVEKSFKQKEIGVLQSVGNAKATSVSSYFDKVQLQLRETAHTKLVVDAMESFAAAFNGISDSDMFSSQENRVKDAAIRQKSVVDFYKNEFSKNLPEIDKKSVVLDSLLPKSDAGIRLQALYLSENPNPLGSKNDLQSAGDGSRYSDYHRKYHSYFNRLLKAHGFYDIFLVEPENGNIVYSVYKEIDYATSLINGPHANSGIGAAFQAAIKSTSHDKSHLIDYAAYLPSYNAPASFISHPILKEGNVVGVLIFQMPVDQINLTLENIYGLGETGKAYLVGETDGLLRSQLAGIEHNTILTETLNPDDLKHALGDGGHSTYIDYLGQQVEASIAPLDILGLNWLIVVEQNTAEAFKELAVIKNAYLYAFALCLFFALGVATWLLRNTLRQLGAEPDILNEIATEIAAGDLTRDFSQTKSPSGTLKTMVSMQQTLKDRDTSDKITMNRMGRLRDGLQKLSTPVALASSEHKITFTNLAMVETATEFATDLRTVVPSFDPANMLELPIAQFSDDPDKLHSILEALTGVHECEFKAGARIYNLVFNAIYNDKNERIGTSMEWQDRTAELRVMEEVDQVVSSANKGELSTRINVSDKQGVYLGLSNGINGLLEVNQKFVSDVSSFLGAISTGDLTQIINGQYEGSFADVKRDANKTVEQLEEVVFNIRSVAESVSTAAREINLGNVDLSQRTEQAAASLEETSTSMLEMTASVSSNADNSKEAKDLAVKAKNFAEEGGQVVGQAVTAMDEINESSRKMANIIGVIDDIAFQTNLLALNASVEAARAGEQGRGFAVVASEVRNLAGRSAIAAKEIKELIDDSVERVDRGTKLVNDSGQTLEQIVTEVKKVTDVVSEISSASQEQSDGISLVNNAIGQLDDATQQNAALVEEASAASESASSQAASLLTMIEFFSTSSSNSNQGKVKLTSVG